MWGALQLEMLVRVDVDYRRCQRLHQEVPRVAQNVVAVSEHMEFPQDGLRQSHAVLLGKEICGLIVGVDV